MLALGWHGGLRLGEVENTAQPFAALSDTASESSDSAHAPQRNDLRESCRSMIRTVSLGAISLICIRSYQVTAIGPGGIFSLNTLTSLVGTDAVVQVYRSTHWQVARRDKGSSCTDLHTPVSRARYSARP